MWVGFTGKEKWRAEHGEWNWLASIGFCWSFVLSGQDSNWSNVCWTLLTISTGYSCKKWPCGHHSTPTTALHCTESVPWREEGRTGKYQHEVKGVPEGAARGNSRDRMLVFSCTPRLESRYRHYPIYKSDEALAIAIAIAMSRAIAMSKPRAKKKTD